MEVWVARRRVVITGLGVVAPNGIGKETFWQNLIAGKSAVDYIHAFDASDFPSKVAAEVRDFDPADYMLFTGAGVRLRIRRPKLSWRERLTPPSHLSALRRFVHQALFHVSTIPG